MNSWFPLSNVSTDTMARILDFLDLDEIFCLWLSGSTKMQRILGSMGAWREFLINDSTYKGIIRIWPRCLLRQLNGLRRLSIVPTAPNRLLPRMKLHQNELLDLPRGLIDLEAGFVDAICDEDLDALPPSLTRLSLPFNTRISMEGLRKLPESLSILHLDRNRLITDARKLPRQLARFAGCPYALTPESHADQLPPGLTHLSLLVPERENKMLETSYKWNVDKLWLFSAHTSLSRLDLTITERNEGQEDVNETWMFSDHLEVLYLRGFYCHLPASALPHLPRNLKKLKLRSLKPTRTGWRDEDIQHLPPGLTCLEHWPLVNNGSLFPPEFLVPLFHPTIACYEHLPRNLETLRLASTDVPPDTDLDARIKAVQALPSTLTKFHTYLKNPQESFRVGLDVPSSCLPPGLTSYSGGFPHGSCAGHLRFSKLLISHIELMSHIPSVLVQQELTSDLKTFLGSGWWHDGLTTLKFHVRLTSSILTLLPKNLVTLSVCAPMWPEQNFDKEMLLLPDTVTELDLPSGYILTDEALPALPADLQILRLGNNDRIRGDLYPFPRRLKTLELCPQTPPNYGPRLPPFLTSLMLRGPQVDERTLCNLPNTLVCLIIKRTKHYLDASVVFPALPPSLLHLGIDSIISYFKDEDVSELPRGLLTLNLPTSGSDLTDRSAELWPPRLQLLAFSGAHYTFEGLCSLPKSLTRISMPEAHYALPPPPGRSTRD